jgi:hypothetical protein
LLLFPGSILLPEVSMQRTGHLFLDDFKYFCFIWYLNTLYQ